MVVFYFSSITSIGIHLLENIGKWRVPNRNRAQQSTNQVRIFIIVNLSELT